MNAVFLDTGYVLALELSNDQNHRAASKHWRSLSKKLPPLVTTSYVFDEVVTYFNSRKYHAKAVEVGNRLLTSPSVQFMQGDEGLFKGGTISSSITTKTIRPQIVSRSSSWGDSG